jgi:hypothetical protein
LKANVFEKAKESEIQRRIAMQSSDDMTDQTSSAPKFDPDNPLPYGGTTDIHGNIIQAITNSEVKTWCLNLTDSASASLKVGAPLGAAVTQIALHHLPDFWKQIALIRIAGMLKDGGRLCLRDMVYSFDPNLPELIGA